MTTILYEHPLNERIRNYLKLEQLFAQANDCLSCKISTSYNIFFSSLFAIIDTLERNDVRSDLIKDLEKLEHNLLIWSDSPDVDDTALAENLRQTVGLTAQLRRVSAPTWALLKENKLLASLKQRFAIQGGSSTFDLPQLQYWLNLPTDTVDEDIRQWLSLLNQIRDALSLILKFIRMRSPFEKIDTESGFYQDSGEGILLLRIRVPVDAGYYPTVSGNRFRYSIRFMLPCELTGKRYSNQATHFELARC